MTIRSNSQRTRDRSGDTVNWNILAIIGIAVTTVVICGWNLIGAVLSYMGKAEDADRESRHRITVIEGKLVEPDVVVRLQTELKELQKDVAKLEDKPCPMNSKEN